MNTEPFSGYLDNLPRWHNAETITQEALLALGFPLPASFISYLVKKYAAAKPVQKARGGHYDVRELISLIRMHSVPLAGYYSHAPVRHAEILELIPDDNNEDLIRTIKVAVAFMQDKDKRRGRGDLCFVCPLCSEIHYHGAVSNSFGSGGGNRGPHCTCYDPTCFRHDTRHIAQRLSRHWDFELVEVKDIRRAGDFPPEDKALLSVRAKGGGKRT